jgi:hydrogenase expression/formation protein HypE
VDANDKIILAHGSGGKLTRRLVGDLLLKKFLHPALAELDDSARVEVGSARVCFTTDSYVVKPLFFPGSDIGKLAVYGTVNDLAVMGAEPLYISCGLIIEEGLERDILERVVNSMAEACQIAAVSLVTGDTKVVESGGADGLFINTAGLGLLPEGRELGINRIKPGDRVIVSGTIGDHAIAVLAAREDLGLKLGELTSDCAPVNHLTKLAVDRFEGVKFMRDPTRGGLATVLCEVAESGRFSVHIWEERIPIRHEVNGICEILGFDPLYLANEGKVVMVVADGIADEVCDVLRSDELGKDAAVIGEIGSDRPGDVILHTAIGGSRLVTMLAGDQLPRIC